MEKIGGKKKVTTKSTLSVAGEGMGEEVFCVRFDLEDKYLACGCGDGTINIFNVLTGKLTQHLNMPNDDQKSAVLGIRWREHKVITETGTKSINYLLACYADGSVNQFQIPPGKLIHSIKDPKNNLYCIDYAKDCTQFACAGKDLKVRVYDEETKALVTSMHSNGYTLPGHSNRIFSLKYHPEDQNIICTGGWDNTVQIYDVRGGGPVGSIFGPVISGDALDISGNNLITGSHRGKDPLQLWDLGQREMIQSIEWEIGSTFSESAFLFGTQFSKKNGDLIAAGGKGDELKIFERDEEKYVNNSKFS